MTGPTRDITVDVTIRSDTKGAKDGAAALGDVDKAAAGAGASMKRMDVDSKALTAQIDKSKATIKDLESELTKVGNNPGIRKSLRVERSWLAELERVGKDVAEDAARFGIQSAEQFTGSFTEGLGGLGKYAMPALIGAAALLTPVIGGMVSGAVVGAVGIGGIAGGIAAASTDSSVKEAWKGFTSSLSADDFGKQAFIEPVKQGIAELQKGLEGLNIGESISKGAASVPVLARGVSDFASNIMPGFNAVMNRSGEISAIVAEGLGKVGGSLGTLIFDVTESKGSMDGLRSIFGATSLAIGTTGDILSFLSDRYHDILFESAALTGDLEDQYRNIPLVGNAWATLNDKLEELLGTGPGVVKTLSSMDAATQAINAGLDPFAAYLNNATVAAAAYQETLLDLEKTELAMSNATLAWKQDVLDLTEAVKEQGHSTADNTEVGLKNQQMINGLIGDAVRLADAKKAETGSNAEANKVYDEQIDKLTILLQKLGFTKAQIDALVGPHRIDIITNFITTGNSAQINKNLRAEDLAGGRAEGGPVAAGQTYLVGERGPEIVTFGADGFVHANSSLTPTAGGATGGASTINYTITVNAAPFTSPVETGAAVVAALKQYEMANGHGWRS